MHHSLESDEGDGDSRKIFFEFGCVALCCIVCFLKECCMDLKKTRKKVTKTLFRRYSINRCSIFEFVTLASDFKIEDGN